MNYVEISYSKRRPKKLENDVFVLYTPERIKLQPGEIKIVDMKLHSKLSKNLVEAVYCYLHLHHKTSNL